MSHIFDLNDMDGTEDYLNFDFPGDQEPSPVPPSDPKPIRGRPSKKSSSGSTVVRPRARPTSPPLNFYDIDMPVDADNSVGGSAPNNKRIPLKQVGEHQCLINQLNAYAGSLRFKPILDECGVKIKDLGTKSLAELKELRERVRACCANSGGGGGVVATVALTGCSGLEHMMPKRLANLEGYRRAVEANPEFAAICEMIEIDSGFKTSMTPMQRMVMCLGMTAASVAAENKAKDALRNANGHLLASLRAQEAAGSNQPVPPIVPAAAAPLPVSAPQTKPTGTPHSMYD